METRLDLTAEAAGYDSTFEEAEASKRDDSVPRSKPRTAGPSAAPKARAADVFNDEVAREEGRRQRTHFLALNAYDRHKQLVNNYLLTAPGATNRLGRDTSKDRRDIDVVRQHHRFLWDDVDEKTLTWEQALAKRYFDRLFKEYCICDLSRYKESKVAMRWRTENEVRDGKGQFVCGSRKCGEAEMLRSWEVNFAYLEDGAKRNALVKVRLCPDCSYKLNYYHKRKDVTKKKKKKKRRRSGRSSDRDSGDEDEKKRAKYAEEQEQAAADKAMAKKASEIWSAPVEVEQEKTRDEDFSEFLEDLFM